MPELPEVETVIRGLKKVILGKSIERVSLHSPKIQTDNYRGWLDDLLGREFIDIRRRGKNILIDLSGGKTLWVHLKMTGHFYYLPQDTPLDKHDLMVFTIKGYSDSLRFNDYRRFGRIRLFSTDKVLLERGLVELGPEPLELGLPDFIDLFRNSKRMIKPALLDQTFLAGLGNIYADESLYDARIHPRKQTDRISAKKLGTLHEAIQDKLKKAIRLMGTSVDSFSGVNGQPGRYQKYLYVYGREGELCIRCSAKIRREKIGSRSAHYCPHCQRLK